MNETIANTYKNTIKIVCECGNTINDSNTIDNLHKNVFLDLLYRIKQNCNSLIKLSNLEEDYLAIRLLQRSIIGDLITVFFFISLLDDNQKFSRAMEVLDNLSEKSIKEWLKVHWKIDKTNANDRGEEYISKEDYFEQFDTYSQHYFSGSNNEQAKKAKVTDWGFNGKPSSMKTCTEHHELGKPIKYLYAEYRFLSQIEHYSPFNRGFSHSKDTYIKTHGEVIGYSIQYLLDVIKDRFKNTEQITSI